MKSERRHELKTNALARGLEGLPTLLQRHGSQLLSALLVILLVVLAIVLWRSRSQQKADQAAVALEDARRSIAQLPSTLQRAPSAAMPLRQQIVQTAEQAITSVLESSNDAEVRAEAMTLRGDLNWQLAALPPFPGAATQPALQAPESADSYRKRAESAYQEVLNSGAAAPETAAIARLSLAAIAEDRADWDAAQKQYQAVMDDANVPQSIKTQAASRLNLLGDLRTPVLLAAPTTKPAGMASLLESLQGMNTAQTTQPAATQSSTMTPTTQPAASQPATTPTTLP